MRLATRLILAATTCALLIGAALPAVSAADTCAAAKEVMAKYCDAVVTVTVVIRIQMSYEGQAGEKREMKNETTGTVLDATGLTVVSLSQIDPESYWKSFGMDESSGYQYSVETADVKIRLASGQDVPAKIVLRDKDLDLAFVRPARKLASPAPFVDFAAGAKLAALDDMVILDRLGKAAGRIPGIRIDRVQAVMEKPRTFYVPAIECLRSSPGAPVFSSDGKAVGLITLRVSPSAGQKDMGSSPDDAFLFVALPAADVLEIAKQAPEQAVEEKKPAVLAPKPAPAAPKPAAKPAPKPPAKPAAKPAK